MTDDKPDLLKLRLARESKEKSRAMPRGAYGDPSQWVKFEREYIEEEKQRKIKRKGK